MSAEVAVKKRGRPKKVVEPETVLLVETDINTTGEILPVKPRKTRTTRTTRSPKVSLTEEVASEKKTVRKSKVVENVNDTEASKGTRTKKSAKSIQNTTPIELQQTDRKSSPATITTLTSQAVLASTKEADVVRQTSDVLLEPLGLLQQDPIVKEGQLPGGKDISILVDRSIELLRTDSSRTQSVAEVKSDLVVKAQSPISQADCEKHSIAETQQAVNSTSRLRTQFLQLGATLEQNSAILRALDADINTILSQARRSARIQSLSLAIDQLSQRSVNVATVINDINLRRAAVEFSQTSPAILETSTSQPPKTDNVLPTSDAQNEPEPITLTDPQNSALSSIPIVSTPTMSKPQSQVPSSQLQPPSQKPAQPSTHTTNPQRLTPRPPIRPTKTPSPTTPPQPSRPTEQTLAELKRNPDFKRLSRSWTGLIVGIPVVIATSYALWKNYNTRQMERTLGLSSEAENIGVDRRKTGGLSNGGV